MLNVTVAVHDKNIQPRSKSPFKFGGVAVGWHNHNREVGNNVAPPFKAYSDVPHAATGGYQTFAARIVYRFGIGWQLFECHGLPPALLLILRSSRAA